MSFTGHEEQPLGRSQFAPQRNRLRDERTDPNYGGSQVGAHLSTFAKQQQHSERLTERYESAQRSGDDDEVESVWGEILDYERQRLAAYRTRMQAARDAA